MSAVVIVAYEVGTALETFLLNLDANSYGIADTPCREVFRQVTGEHVDLERAFVVAARSFGAPAVR